MSSVWSMSNSWMPYRNGFAESLEWIYRIALIDTPIQRLHNRCEEKDDIRVLDDIVERQQVLVVSNDGQGRFV